MFLTRIIISKQICRSFTRSLYIQGQSPEAKVREYFYYIDHQGMLFLDDAKMKNFTSCYKELHFLKFFFKRLKKNDSMRYTEDFPYLSLCGKERNFVRCDDLPIVFTEVIQDESDDIPLLSYNNGSRFLTVDFQPEKICMMPSTGRIYHPGPEKTGGIGLLGDKLGILWTTEQRFIFGNGEENPPTQFVWNDERKDLTNELVSKLPSSDHDQTTVDSENRKKSSNQQDHEYQVLHDFATKEFVLFCDEDRSSKAYVKYEVVSNQSIHFLTTQVPISQKGKGIGKILVKEVLEFCVENQMRFSSSCWYIDDYITKYPSKKYRKLFQK